MKAIVDHLRDTRPDAAGRSGRVKVLVALRRTDVTVRKRLEQIGLSVETALTTKLIGSIEGGALERLRADPDVAEVEASAMLKPTSR